MKLNKETAMALLALVAIFMAFALVGTPDYHDECHDLAYWSDRGVEIVRR